MEHKEYIYRETPCGGAPIARQDVAGLLRALEIHVKGCEKCKGIIAEEYMSGVYRLYNLTHDIQARAEGGK